MTTTKKSNNRLPSAGFHWDLDGLMDQFFQASPLHAKARSGYFPRGTVMETDQSYQVELELPGVNSDDVHVEIQDGALVISGEKKVELDQQDVKYHHVERQSGRFDRQFEFATPIDFDQVDAKMVDGVLTVVIPKSAAARPRRVDIKTGD